MGIFGDLGIGKQSVDEKELLGILDVFLANKDEFREYLSFAECMMQKTTSRKKRQAVSELELKGDVSAYEKVFGNLGRCQPTLDFIGRVQHKAGEIEQYRSIKEAILQEADGEFDFYKDADFLQKRGITCPFKNDTTNIIEMVQFQMSYMVSERKGRSFESNAKSFPICESLVSSELSSARREVLEMLMYCLKAMPEKRDFFSERLKEVGQIQPVSIQEEVSAGNSIKHDKNEYDDHLKSIYVDDELTPEELRAREDADFLQFAQDLINGDGDRV